MMVLAVNDYDPGIVARLLSESAPPLPDPLWSATYTPYQGWTQVFQKDAPKMIDANGDTTRFLESGKAQWIECAVRVRNQASVVLALPEQHTGSASPR